MKKFILLTSMLTCLFYNFPSQAVTNKIKTKQETRTERKALRKALRAHNRIIRQQQNQIAYNKALQALKSNRWVVQANTLYNNYGISIPVTDNTNFVAMNNKQVSLQLAFSGINPGPNGLGGITITGWPNSIHLHVDKKGNVTYRFGVMGAAIFAQVTIRMGYGSNYATALVCSNISGKQLTFSGNLVPYSQSDIFQSGFSF